MNEEKKTFEAPVLTSVVTEGVDLLTTSTTTTNWYTNRYNIPEL